MFASFFLKECFLFHNQDSDRKSIIIYELAVYIKTKKGKVEVAQDLNGYERLAAGHS